MIYDRIRCPAHCDVRLMSEISSTGNGKVAGIADGLPGKVVVSQPSPVPTSCCSELDNTVELLLLSENLG